MLVRGDVPVMTSEGTLLAGAYAKLKDLPMVPKPRCTLVFEGNYQIHLAADESLCEKLRGGETFTTCTCEAALDLNEEFAFLMGVYTWFGAAQKIILPSIMKEALVKRLRDIAEKFSGAVIEYKKVGGAWTFSVEAVQKMFEFGAAPGRIPAIIYSAPFNAVVSFLKPLHWIWEKGMHGASLKLPPKMEGFEWLLGSRLNVFPVSRNGMLYFRPRDVRYIEYLWGIEKMAEAPRQKITLDSIYITQSVEAFYDVPAECVAGIKL